VVLAIGLAVWREWISQHKNDLFAQQEELDQGKSLIKVDQPSQDTLL